MDSNPILGSLVGMSCMGWLEPEPPTDVFFRRFIRPRTAAEIDICDQCLALIKQMGYHTGEWYAVFSLAVKLLGEYFGYAFSQFAV